MKKTPLTIIFLIVFIDLLGFGIVIPILPSYAERGFGASDLTVGLLVAAFSAAQFLFTPVWGRLSDRFGRRPILLVGLCMTAISYVLFGLATSLTLLFISRLLGGIGGANISAAQAYIADVTKPEERARGMGLIGAAFGLGFVFGPVMGGLLVEHGYHVPGFAAAALSTIALVTAIFFLPESHTDRSSTQHVYPHHALGAALRRPHTALLLALFFLVTFGYANIYATFPMISTREFGFTDRQVGYLFGFIGLIGALVQGGLIRPLTGRYSERLLFRIGAACTMVGLVLIPYSGHSTALLLAVLVVLSFGSGLINPTTLSMISKSAEASDQGGVLGINQSMGALARSLGPVWGAFVFQSFGHPWPFLTGGIVLLLVLLMSLRGL